MVRTVWDWIPFMIVAAGLLLNWMLGDTVVGTIMLGLCVILLIFWMVSSVQRASAATTKIGVSDTLIDAAMLLFIGYSSFSVWKTEKFLLFIVICWAILAIRDVVILVKVRRKAG